jgi:hypothetical protein
MPRSQYVHISLAFIFNAYMILDSVDGQLVIKDIIPAISRMRNKYRITFSTMFNQPLLKSQNTLPTVEFGDFARSDMFFNQMIFE